VEMTRQNVTEGVREILTKPCPTCNGEGVVPSEETVAIDILRQLRDLVAERTDPEAFLIRANPKVVTKLIEDGSGLSDLEAASHKHFHFEGGDALPLETYDVAAEGTRAEIEERALPFKVGDEVLVTIEEPHMYDPDDAVARVDSYIVSVGGGGAHVGERRMVRIESVGRSSASATLLDANGAGPGDGEKVESAPSERRRGQSGGGRRSSVSDET